MSAEGTAPGPSLESRLDVYLEARPDLAPGSGTASQVSSYAADLAFAIGADDPVAIRNAVADIVLSTALVARNHQFTVEEAIVAKTARDAAHRRGDGAR